MAASASAVKVTWGVELEFCVKPIAGKIANSADAIAVICKYLYERTGYPVAGECCCRERRGQTILCPGCASVSEEQRLGHHTLYSDINSVGAEVKDPWQTRSTAWYVYTEPCGRPQDNPGRLIGLEITSPRANSEQNDEAFGKLNQIIGLLANAEFEVSVNPNHGMHVHVGVGDGLDQLNTKKVITLTTLLEMSFLYGTQPAYRREKCAEHASSIVTESILTKNLSHVEYNWALRAAYKREKATVDAHVPLAARQGNRFWTRHGKAMERIFHAAWTAPAELEMMAHGLCRVEDEGRAGLALRLRQEPNKDSFEFRYGHMTFDTAFIRYWVSTASRIVQVSASDTATFAATTTAVLGAIADCDWKADTVTTVEGVLVALGFAQEAKDWAPMVISHSRGDDASIDARGVLGSS